MKLLEIFEEKTSSDPEGNMRALFNSAIEKSEEFGTQFSAKDLMYEIFQCQLEIHRLKKIAEAQRRRRTSRKL